MAQLIAGQPSTAIGTDGASFAPANSKRMREYLASEIAK